MSDYDHRQSYFANVPTLPDIENLGVEPMSDSEWRMLVKRKTGSKHVLLYSAGDDIGPDDIVGIIEDGLSSTPVHAIKTARTAGAATPRIFAMKFHIDAVAPDVKFPGGVKSASPDGEIAIRLKVTEYDPSLVSDIVEIAADHAGNYVLLDDLDEANERQNDLSHREHLERTGFWGNRGAGCWFLSAQTGRVLLPLRSRHVLEPETWGTWGGAVDHGLSIIEAIEKEVKQEAGYTGECVYVPLSVFRHESGFSYHNYLAVVDHEFEPELNWESSDYRWCDLDNLPSPLHPGVKTMLKESKHIIDRLAALCSDGDSVELNKLLDAHRLIHAEATQGQRKRARPE